jgi:hypothetical protein
MPRLKYKRSIPGYSWAREFAEVFEYVDSTGRYKLQFWSSVVVGRRLESVVSTCLKILLSAPATLIT